MSPTILVSTWDDGVFALAGNQRAHELPGQPVRGLAADGRGSALAIVGGRSLQRRAPDGRWTTLATSACDLSCCLAVGDVLYVGTDDARLLRMDESTGMLRPLDAFDDMAGRDTWFAGSAIVDGVRRGPPLGVRSLAAKAGGHIVFANVHVGGIPRSIDGGKTWEPTVPVDYDVHEVRAHANIPRLVAAAAAVGLCLSRDAGSTWTVETNGLHASHCSAVAFVGDDLLVSASADPFAAEGRIYRRTLKPDGALVPVEGGMPPWTEGIVDTGCIATLGSSVAAADRGGNVYASDDAGRTWSRRTTGLPTPSGVLLG